MKLSISSSLYHRTVSNIVLHSANLLIFAILCVMATACGTSRHSASSTSGGTQLPSAGAETLAHDYTGLISSYQPQWERLEIPVSVKAAGLPLSLSGTVFMERGQSIAMSLKMLGMEVASAKITTDTIFVVDRYHGRHLIVPFSDLANSFPVTVENLQDLLLGRVFLAGQSRLPEKADSRLFRLERDRSTEGNGDWYMLPDAENLPFDYGFALNALPCLTALGIGMPGDRSATVSYSQTDKPTPYGRFANDISVRLTTGKNATENFSGRLQWRMDKAKWNDDARNVKVSLPSNSKPISAASLLKALGGGAQ